MNNDLIPARSLLLVLGLAFSAADLAFAQEQSASAPPTEQAEAAPASETKPAPMPAFKTLRFDEDWSEFDPTASDDVWADVKKIKLNHDGTIWMSIGGEFRMRAEYWSNFGFNDAETNEDTFVLGRILTHADIHFGESVRIFIEGKSAFSTDRDLPGGRRTLDVDNIDVQDAFADIRLHQSEKAELTGRIGRQELLYGKQRLVSPLPWGNTLRSWDGGKLMFRSGDLRIDGFYTRFAEVEKYDFNDWTPGPDFFGVYATTKIGENKKLDFDLYWLGVQGKRVTYNGTTGEETRHTFGARVGGAIPDTPFDFDVEGDLQFGEVGDADVAAWAFAAEGGYTFRDAAWKPRVFVGFDSASGDDEPGDGDVETFNQLFPLGHAYLGYMDFVGRQNILDISGGVSAKPTDALTLRAALHMFWRVSDNDALYNAGGGVVRPGAASNALEVGQEIDLTVQYRMDHHTVIETGYSHFFAGSFIKDSGPGSDMDWVFAQITYLF